MPRSFRCACALLLVTGCGPEQPGPTEADADTASDFLPDLFEAEIGTVSFPVSCGEQAARAVERGHRVHDAR